MSRFVPLVCCACKANNFKDEFGKIRRYDCGVCTENNRNGDVVQIQKVCKGCFTVLLE